MTLIPWVSLGYPPLKPARLTHPCAAIPDRPTVIPDCPHRHSRASGNPERYCLRMLQPCQATAGIPAYAGMTVGGGGNDGGAAAGMVVGGRE